MKKRIHINQHVIRANKKNGTNDPAITVKTSKENIYADRVEIDGPSSVVYSPDKPLSCGARVWIETDAPVTLHGLDKEKFTLIRDRMVIA
jgi:hypothetical protein